MHATFLFKHCSYGNVATFHAVHPLLVTVNTGIHQQQLKRNLMSCLTRQELKNKALDYRGSVKQTAFLGGPVKKQTTFYR